METKEKHIHSYKRHITAKGRTMYFCTHPECFFKTQKEFLHGKIASCPGCGSNFVLGSYELKLATPKCERCRSDVKAENLKLALGAVGSVLSKLKENEGQAEAQIDETEGNLSASNGRESSGSED